MNNTQVVLLAASLLLPLLPVWLLFLLNRRKEDRYRQLRMPVIALLFSALSCALVARLEELADLLMSLNLVQRLINLISPSGLFSYAIQIYTAILSNALLFAIFFVVKLFAGAGLKKRTWPAALEKLGPLGKLWFFGVALFYQKERGRVVLLRRWVFVEYTLRWAVRILGLSYLLLAAALQLPILGIQTISLDFLDNCARALYMLPAVTLIFINEFRWYLDGQREFSNAGKYIYDASSLRRIYDFSELAEQYRQQFPERFCADLKSNAVGTAVSAFNDASNDSPLAKAIADQLKERGYLVNGNYLACVDNLFKRNAVLVNSSVFSDFGEYLFIYLNTLLARGENVLFLCADEDSAEGFRGYIADRFHGVNNYHEIWLIKDASAVHGTSDADVLVMSPQFVMDDNVFVGQARFFSRLSVVVLVNAAEIIARDGVVLTTLAHRLAQIAPDDPQRRLQYICLSESIHPETSNALKQVLNLHEEFYVCEGYQSFENTHLMLWNYEAAREFPGSKDTLAQDNLFGSSSQSFWGVGIPLACVGMKYGVERISLIAHTGTPYLQIVGSIKNQISRLTDYFGTDIGFSDFERVLRFNRVDPEDPHTAFIIVEDDLFNLPLAIYNYCRFGGAESGMIHIVSKPYMLRDYFTANAEQYLSSESRIDMIMPALSDTRQIVLTRILCEALGRGIEQEVLLERVRSIAPEIKDLDRALRYCRDAFFPNSASSPIEYSFSQHVESVFNEQDVCFENRVLIRMKQDSPLARLLTDARLARMELRGRLETIGVFASRLRQSFVTTQSFAHNGSVYRVAGIDTEKGIVHVTESADRLNVPVDYIQVRKYSLIGEPADTDVFPVTYGSGKQRMTGGYEARLYHRVNLTVDTLGYYALSPFNPTLDLKNGPDYKPFSAAERQNHFREYSGATVLAFRIKGVGEERADRTAFLLAVMMNELLKTFFPYSYPCIAVCPNLSDPETLLAEEMAGRIASAYPQISVSEQFLHDPEDAEVILVEDSATDLGLLRTLLQNEQYPFGIFLGTILSYLKWCKRFSPSGNISNRYLYFGADAMPACFDPETLSGICEEFETVRRGDSIRVELVNTKGYCSYCHRELVNVAYTELQDGAGRYNRKLCDRCSRLIVRDRDQLESLYRQTRRYLTEEFGISLPEDITVRFATAEALRKRVGSGDKRIVVGLADLKARELWVESDAPPANVLDVLVHELTHFWQNEHLNTSDLTYLEGQASYVEVQFMRSEKQKEFADWLEGDFKRRRDVYGKGYRLIKNALKDRNDQDSFRYMLELFGTGQGGDPPRIEKSVDATGSTA